MTEEVKKFEKASEELLREEACRLMDFAQDLKDLEEGMGELKLWFREQAQGEKLVTTVEGRGTVTVKTPSEAKTTEVIQFDSTKIGLLTPAIQKKLVEVGVIKYATVTSKPGTPAVEVKLNV